MPATTLSVPAKVQELALSRKGEVMRIDVGLAQREMLKLGISANSEFFAFFSAFQAVNLYSTVSYETLREPLIKATVPGFFVPGAGLFKFASS